MSDTLFVTGATGFLGHHLIPALCGAGYKVRALVRHPDHHAWLRQYPIEIIQGDILDVEVAQRGATGARYVIHAAGIFRFWGDEAEFDRVNVGGARSVITAAQAAGCERVIHISTIYLIGQPPRDQTIDET